MLIPTLILEGGLRVYLQLRPLTWFYPGAVNAFANVPEHYLFLGSSRVAAAIDPPAFATELALGERAQVFNLGQGASTMPMHALGLGQLWRAHPTLTRGCTVFIEAPGGIPDSSPWDSDWFYDRYPMTFASVLDRAVWPRFLRECRNSAMAKAFVTAGCVSKACLLMPGYRDRLTAYAEKRVDRWVQARLEPAAIAVDGDLSESGGIRTAPAAVRRARESAAADAQRETAHQKPAGEWNKSVLADVVRLVQAAGGELIFFEPPLCSVQRDPYVTPLRRREQQEFARQIEAWGCAMLRPAATFEDDAFPDFWHLARSHAPTFTRSLAQAYAARCEAASPRKREQ